MSELFPGGGPHYGCCISCGVLLVPATIVLLPGGGTCYECSTILLCIASPRNSRLVLVMGAVYLAVYIVIKVLFPSGRPRYGCCILQYVAYC